MDHNKHYIYLPKGAKGQRHKYHIVDPSPWPIGVSMGLLSVTIHLVYVIHGYGGME